MSKSAQGIDFHQALAVLSARSPENHEETKQMASCPCSSHGLLSDDGANKFLPTMGQIIDLDAGKEEGTSEAAANESDKDAEKTSERKQEWLDSIGRLSTRRLLQAVSEAQEQRVATYREYDRGLQAVLTTNNVGYYPTVCTEATAAFSVVSDSFKALQGEILKRNSGKEYDKVIRTLQKHEQLKLQYTAALHLEQIRFHQANDQDPTKPLLRESVTSLQAKLAACVNEINEALEEIQCAVTDAADDDGASS